MLLQHILHNYSRFLYEDGFFSVSLSPPPLFPHSLLLLSPCSSTMSQPGRSLPDMRARDIRRRVDVIQKKLSDLQELGVPCAFCYSSVRNTGSLFTLGDHRITEVMERHKNEILKNLIESRQDVEGGRKKEIHLILPPLPAPLEELNRSMMQSLIVGILKDLGLRWSDPKPQWWPLDIPFFPPRSVPDSFKGMWRAYH